MTKTNEELQADLEKALTSIEKLEGFNAVLKQENKDALNKARKAEEAIEEAEAAKGSELDKAIKRAEKAEKSIKDMEERAAQAETNLRNTRADTALTSALAAANIDSKSLGFLTDSLKTKVQFTDDGEPLLNGKSVADHVKELTSPKGALHHLVNAPNHSGGVAMGYDGTKAPRMTKENFNYSEFAKIQMENPAEANAIADAVGKPNLIVKLD